MPLLIPLAFLWISGLAAGRWVPLDGALGPVRAWALVVAVLGGMACLLASRHHARVGRSQEGVPLAPWLAAAVLAAGVAAAWGHRRHVEGCTRRLEAVLAGDGRVEAVLEADEPPWRTVPVLLRLSTGHPMAAPFLASCQLPSQLVLPAPRPRRALAGERLLVAGQLRRQGDRLRLEAHGAVAWGPGPPDRLRSWRGSVGRQIDAHFGEAAPLARALLVADQRDIPPAVRDRYADAGLVHLLSVSGMHVAIIAVALGTLGTALRLPRGGVTAATLLLVSAYVLLLGAPAPAVRSAVMLAVDLLAVRLQHPVHPWTALALGAVVPTTVDAAVVVNLGWQLSVAGMAALVAARPLLRPRPVLGRRVPRSLVARLQRRLARLRGLRRTVALELCTGVLAGVVTAPLLAWHFGRISLVAPLANLVAAPVIALLQPALFLAIALAPAPPLMAWVADACRALMALLDVTASAAAGLPGGAVSVAPTGVEAAACAVAVGCLLVATAARRPMLWWRVGVAAGGLALAAPLLPMGSGELELHVLDVGQGDAIALRTPLGRWVLIDAGRRWEGGDAGRRVVIPHVRRLGGAVALFVLSHAHEDHAGGAPTVLEALRPAGWWEPAFVTSSPAYAQALATAERRGIPWERVGPGRRLLLDGVTLTVLAPDSSWTAQQHDANETSVVLRVDFGTRRLLLTGDAEASEEGWMVERVGCAALRADVLKLGHHGSRTSTTPAFLSAVSPRLAIASVGAGNRYGHPSPAVTERLASQGIPLWRTDEDGTVVVRTNGRSLSVEGRGGRWHLPPQAAGAEARLPCPP
jgi:competence protein ComEC